MSIPYSLEDLDTTLVRILEAEKEGWAAQLEASGLDPRTDLVGIDFDEVYLKGADFTDADLRGASFRGARVEEVNFLQADLADADFFEARLWRVVFENTNLQRADFRRAVLWRADLRGADLRGADLWRADLRGADLRGANLFGADLRYARLQGADYDPDGLAGAIFAPSFEDITASRQAFGTHVSPEENVPSSSEYEHPKGTEGGKKSTPIDPSVARATTPGIDVRVRERAVQAKEEVLGVEARETRVESDEVTGGVEWVDVEPDFRTHYKTAYESNDYDYDYYEPAYRYGYEMARKSDYRDMDFGRAEGDLRKGYVRRHDEGLWDETKDAVRHGYNAVRKKF